MDFIEEVLAWFLWINSRLKIFSANIRVSEHFLNQRGASLNKQECESIFSWNLLKWGSMFKLLHHSWCRGSTWSRIIDPMYITIISVGGKGARATPPQVGQKSFSLGQIFWRTIGNWGNFTACSPALFDISDRRFTAPSKFDVLLRPWSLSVVLISNDF